MATIGSESSRREPHGCGHQRVVVGATRALHFEVVAPRKEARPRARGLRRAAGVALQERAADLAVARARKRDQPVGAFLQPVALQFRAAAMLIGPVRPRQPFGEPQVSGARLREQQRAERLVALGLVRQPDVAPDDGLDACGARRAIELDETECIGEIGDRERGHFVGARSGDAVVDAHVPSTIENSLCRRR